MLINVPPVLPKQFEDVHLDSEKCAEHYFLISRLTDDQNKTSFALYKVNPVVTVNVGMLFFMFFSDFGQVQAQKPSGQDHVLT